MKSYDSRVYSINDFTEWDKQGQLALNPFFQRRGRLERQRQKLSNGYDNSRQTNPEDIYPPEGQRHH